MVVGLSCNSPSCSFSRAHDGAFTPRFVEINAHPGLTNHMNLEFGSGLCNFVSNESGFVCVDLSAILARDTS